MDKKLINIDQQIPAFLNYLKKAVGIDVMNFLENLSRISEVHIFSGVIRNFFINYNGAIRDLDLVVKCDEYQFLQIIKDYSYKKNSFDGFKLNLNGVNLDIWYIDNTWAYVNNKVELTLFKDYSLPSTAFFNFSAAVFDFNDKEFIVTRDFINFLENRELDLVLKSNPIPQLCLVNTIYYCEKFKLKVSNKLKIYYLENFYDYSEEQFNLVQKKHFGVVLYEYLVLKEYYKIFFYSIEKSNNIYRLRQKI